MAPHLYCTHGQRNRSNVVLAASSFKIAYSGLGGVSPWPRSSSPIPQSRTGSGHGLSGAEGCLASWLEVEFVKPWWTSLCRHTADRRVTRKESSDQEELSG